MTATVVLSYVTTKGKMMSRCSVRNEPTGWAVLWAGAILVWIGKAVILTFLIVLFIGIAIWIIWRMLSHSADKRFWRSIEQNRLVRQADFENQQYLNDQRNLYGNYEPYTMPVTREQAMPNHLAWSQEDSNHELYNQGNR